MKKNKKIQKKQVKTAKLPGLIALLVLSILLLVAYFMKDYNPGLQKEAEGFTKLKQDFLDLQKEFNKVDTGWTYHEGCRGKGGVYNDDEASSCRLLLTSRDTSEYTLIQNHFEGYVQILTDSGDFTTTDMTKEIMWSISDPGDMTKISSHTLRRSSWPDANCSLRDFFSSDKANGGIELECDHSSHYFRYPRYDK